MTLGMTFKIYTSVVKELKLKVRKSWGLILRFVEVTEKKLVGEGGILQPPFPSSVELKGSTCWKRFNQILEKF